MEHYGVDSMKAKAREDFQKWYSEKSAEEGYEFDLREELLKYCEADVSILRQAAMKFRQLLIDHQNIDPFTCGAVTLPGTCMETYRQVGDCLLLSGGWVRGNSVVGSVGGWCARGGPTHQPTHPTDHTKQTNLTRQNRQKKFTELPQA